MSIKVGINGFGRIGRLFFRSTYENPKLKDIEIVGINDLIDVEYMAYMLRYDSIHGQFKGEIAVQDGKLVVNGKAIRVTAEKDPANLKWSDIGAEYVVEATGLFLTKEKAEGHIKSGAKKAEGLTTKPAEKRPVQEQSSPRAPIKKVKPPLKASTVEESEPAPADAIPVNTAVRTEPLPPINKTEQEQKVPPLEDEKTHQKARIYVVQVGTFANITGAKRTAAELRDQGFSPRIYWDQDKTGRILHVVLLGVYEERSRAREIAFKHQKEGGGALLVRRMDPILIEEREIALD